MMHSSEFILSNDDDRLEAFIADLTTAVYQAVLSSGAINWLDLQLSLWRVVRECIAEWEVIDNVPFASFEPPEGLVGTRLVNSGR
ncbi:hypothetical protein Pan44_10630 [Caulifigura coniformis]|uniref:Uncharacterized protein n=1 Tax=Caulifigura coniformis TaxID=2527983 RepID=A0A517SAA5_9PLAN|nr:hypothetical protein [Caulifigura coniformis]QDT53048.1 hypothetical protein Pan44_10630 [Caulifigura coniformis]